MGFKRPGLLEELPAGGYAMALHGSSACRTCCDQLVMSGAPRHAAMAQGSACVVR